MRALTYLSALFLGFNALPELEASPTVPQYPVSAPTFPPNIITAFIEDLRERYRVPGIGLGIVKKTQHGWDEYAGHFGIANAQGDPVTEHSLFSIASNSKLYTMLAVGLLIENGTVLPNGEVLDWNTKIKNILPEWKLMDEYASEHVDVIDLLAHRTGLPRHDHSHGEGDDPSEVVAGLRYLRPSYEIRQKWQYNNQQYITLAHIVTTLSGITFGDYVSRHILQPLNMTETTYNATWAAQTGHRTDGFIRTGMNVTQCAEKWKGVTRVIDESCLGEPRSLGWWTKTDGSFEAGAGGVITCPKDMVKWLRELVDPKIIPKHLIDLAGKTVEVAEGTPPQPEEGIVTYGLAQIAWSYRGINLVGHTGSFAGQRSLLIRVPDHDFAVLVTTNDEDHGIPILKLIAYRIIDDLAGLSTFEWEDRLMGQWFNRYPKLKDVPENPIPASSEETVVGTYYDRGYGNFTVQPAQKVEQTVAISAVPLNVTGPIYFSQIDKAFVSHLMFTHWSGNVFNWTAVQVLPALGKDRTPSEVPLLKLEGTGSAVFDGQGLGLFGNFWGAEGSQAANWVDENSKQYQEEADVWFTKI